tara:strand:- start:358 stop:1359 length:1002 start_codon:yes stop_codon:yes gene_type:complete
MRIVNADSYNIYIGDDSLSLINFSKYSKVAILVDENTKKCCLPIFLKKNQLFKDAIIIEVPAGEKYKNINTCNLIWNSFAQNDFDRESLLINLGGGVIGDMGGFSASTYNRGIDFVHVPTTLLAMVDASIGGKLGVNIDRIKNKIGLFNNPKNVLVYPSFLESLDKYHLHTGLAEVLKHMLISSKDQWKSFKKSDIQEIISEDIIFQSIYLKNNIVLEDPKETGKRKILNFGHTFGHAIESYYLSKGSPISHGQAVFMGIILETEMSNLSDLDKIDIKEFILTNFKLPYMPSKKELLLFLKFDKKNKNGKVNFSLLNGIGDCTVDNLYYIDEI